MNILAQIAYAAAMQDCREVLERIASKMDAGEELTHEDRKVIQDALDATEGW